MNLEELKLPNVIYVLGVCLLSGLAMWISKNPNWIWFALFAFFGII